MMTQAGPGELPQGPSPAGRTVGATEAHYGWTRTFIYERLGAGDLEAVKAGRRTIITVESADRLFRTLPRATYRRIDRGNV